MPKFTLTKHRDNDFDCDVTVTFDTDMLGVARDHFEDFLKASGFEIPLESYVKSDTEKWLEKAEDAMWDDAFDFKFKYTMNDDGPVGSSGSDVIDFPSRY